MSVPIRSTIRTVSGRGLFFFLSLTLVVIISLNLLGVRGISYRPMVKLDVCLIVTSVTLLTAYFLRLFPMARLLLYLLGFVHIGVIFLMLYYALAYDLNPGTCVMTQVSVSLFVIFFSIIGYLGWWTCVFSVVSLLAYAAAIRLLPDNWALSHFFWMYFVFLVFVNWFGLRMYSDYKGLQTRCHELEDEEDRIASQLGVDRKQMLALIELSSKNRPSPEKVSSLLAMLPEMPRMRLCEAVSDYMRRNWYDDNSIGRLFPDLSPAERAVCRWVLQGKKVSEISEILQKSQGVVTCHRTHIRQKMGLKSDDDLRDKLVEIIGGRLKELGMDYPNSKE